MKKKTHKEFKKWIKESIDMYVPILGLQLNEILIEHGKETNYLEIECNYPYIDSNIKYSEKAFENWEKGEMKRHRILHELCHIITDPLYVKAIERYVTKIDINDERERLTDIMSAIIRRLFDKD